ncbi:MAG: hypothetical protein MUE81_18280 [Thermoflexibacter sp.]|jgi:hypothetical protein|nr:hypothetical protein [Thermoflexibacter sp.]
MNILIPKNCILLIISLLGTEIFAQNLPTERNIQEASYWFNFNFEYFNKHGSMFFAESSWRHSASPLAENFSIAPIYLIQHTLGYEFRLSNQWGIGILGKYVMQKRFDVFFSKIYLNHSGKIKNIEFFKQIGVEQVNYLSRTLENQGRFSGQVGLAHNFALSNGHILRPSLTYDLLIWFDWRNPAIPQNKRRIDQTRLKAEIAYFINKQWSLGLFFMHETDYFFALAQFDKDGVMIKPDRRLNILTPTIGLRLHYLLKNKDIGEEIRLRFLPY